MEDDIDKLKFDLASEGVNIDSVIDKENKPIDIKLEKKSSKNGPPTGFRNSKYRIQDKGNTSSNVNSPTSNIPLTKRTLSPGSQMYVAQQESSIRYVKEEIIPSATYDETSSTVSSNESSSVNGSATTSRDGNNSSLVGTSCNDERGTSISDEAQTNDNSNSVGDNSHSLSSLEYKSGMIPLKRIPSKLSLFTNNTENIYMY